MTDETLTNQSLARELMRAGGAAALATIDDTGAPFASFVLTAPAPDGAPLMLISALAEHTRNLMRDARASLLLVRDPPPGSESLTASRLTLVGRALKDLDPADRRAYVAHHPDARRYDGFADFALYRFAIERGHLVAGFGRIVDLGPGELLAP